MRVGVIASFAIFIAISIAPILSAFAQAEDQGQENFMANCAECHGANARGDGPRSGELPTKPADLTLLAKKNAGIFDPGAVYQVIDGRKPGSRAHLSTDMPIWGCRHPTAPQLKRRIPKHYRPPMTMPSQRVEKRDKGSALGSLLDLPCDSDATIRARILSIIGYLSRIQAP